MPNSHLPIKPILILIGLAVVWGANWAVVKIGGREMAPLFMCGLRSLIAAACLVVWIKARGGRLFPSLALAFHGAVLGLIFGAEFGLLYVGLEYTLASRVYVLLYTAPFFAALGAHFFLSDDKITLGKASGLTLAFGGVALLFVKDLGALNANTLSGDLMIIGAGALWGGSTVYIKKYLAGKTTPSQTLFYLVFFSALAVLGYSLAFERPLVSGLSAMGVFSMFYQSIIVSFLSYLIWTEMIHRYSVTLLHAFSFFTPICGVIISGVIMLHEPVGIGLIAALVLVSLGMVLVNRH
jgi:drug/metabolite transporter (DMT)-like permease